jgi:hypothetical protein
VEKQGSSPVRNSLCASNGGENGIEQLAIIHRLAKVSGCAAIHRLLAVLGGIMRGQDNDGDASVDFGELPLHGQPVHLRHLEIEHDAVRRMGVDRFQKLRTGIECFRVQTSGTQQSREGLPDGFFVIYKSDKRTIGSHSREL